MTYNIREILFLVGALWFASCEHSLLSLREIAAICGAETTTFAADTTTAHDCAAMNLNGARVGGFCSVAWTTLANREATATYSNDHDRQTALTNRQTVAVADLER